MTIILALLFCGICALLFLASRKPKTLTFARKTSINAPLAKVYDHVFSLRAYNDWNPWFELEPDQVVEYEGADGAIGSRMTWSGKRTGSGHMVLGESNGRDALRYDLEFLKPIRGRASANLSLTERDGATDVVWHYSGENSFLARLFSVFMDFEAMIGGQYEKGLARLKSLAERS